MRAILVCGRTLAVGAALILTSLPALLSAAPAAPATPDKAASPVEKIRQELDKPITIKIERQPLTAAIDMLREKTKINFVLDSLTIQQQLGFDPAQPPTPVEIDLKDVKVKSALRTILNSYSLTYAILGDNVLITTDDTAIARQLHQRVSVDLDKVEFAAAVKQLGRDTAANIILDARVIKEAKTQVSMNLEDVPLETAVRLLAEMAGLKPVRVGNVLFITTKQNAQEMRNDPDMEQPPQPGNPKAALWAPGLGGPGFALPGGLGGPGFGGAGAGRAVIIPGAAPANVFIGYFR